MKLRRVVTGRGQNGKSVVALDGSPPWSKDFEHTPGFASAVVWMTPANASPDVARVSSVHATRYVTGR